MISTPYCTYFTVARHPEMDNSTCVTVADNSSLVREMMIVFVYDTECCQDEADDPVNAVLYFHPGWVSDTQKVALCGQLMGTANFLQATFGKPKVIALQNGKFVLKEFGRFILAVGTDRNITQSILQHRADLLSSLLRLFHRDIQTIHDQFTASGQYKNISEKLYHIFETFLPILQYNGNIYQNLPISKLPKSASNTFLEAMHTLQSCQQTKDVLGGTILYHNKVIATQLCPRLTKNLILTDPFRIKTTAEMIPVNFHVPVGCQLIVVYIPISNYEKLQQNSRRIESVTSINTTDSNTNGNSSNNSSSIFPFQFKKKMMKREKSMVFTNIPEESAINDDRESNQSIKDRIDRPTQSTSSLVRPNHLPLRFKNMTSRDLPESGFSSSITFDEHDSYPQFIGRTSVCSTPMTENKILHGNILPICVDPTIINNPPKLENIENSDKPMEMVDNEEAKLKTNALPSIDDSTNVVCKPIEIRSYSFNDISETIKRFSKQILNYTKQNGDYAKLEINSNDENNTNTNQCGGHNKDDDDFVDDNTKIKYRTICDATYPFFNRTGAPVSKYLFQKYVRLQQQQTQQLINDVKASECNRFDRIADTKPNKEVTKDVNDKPFEQIPNVSRKCRKGLSLPLKSLNSDLLGPNPKQASTSTAREPSDNCVSNVSTILDPIAQRRKLSGLQLTPLITKLSLIAINDERSSGFSSWDTTPGIELATPLDGMKLFRRQSSAKLEDIDLNDSGKKTNHIHSDEGALQRVELFICGQNNMTMFLLLDDNSRDKKEIVQNMFDICISKLPRLEANLNQILNVNVAGDKTDGGYSFLNIDSEWDTLERGGPWSNNDLNAIEHMRHDFENNSSLYNLILRGDDSVIYGHQGNGSNIFYKQTSQFQNGLPPPADTMGTISKQARRHLERDHSIILF